MFSSLQDKILLRSVKISFPIYIFGNKFFYLHEYWKNTSLVYIHQATLHSNLLKQHKVLTTSSSWLIKKKKGSMCRIRVSNQNERKPLPSTNLFKHNPIPKKCHDRQNNTIKGTVSKLHLKRKRKYTESDPSNTME